MRELGEFRGGYEGRKGGMCREGNGG